jgi:hypothetical protein
MAAAAVRQILQWINCSKQNVAMNRAKSCPLVPFLVPKSYTQIALCKKKIPRHIEMPALAWSTKYR